MNIAPLVSAILQLVFFVLLAWLLFIRGALQHWPDDPSFIWGVFWGLGLAICLGVALKKWLYIWDCMRAMFRPTRTPATTPGPTPMSIACGSLVAMALMGGLALLVLLMAGILVWRPWEG